MVHQNANFSQQFELELIGRAERRRRKLIAHGFFMEKLRDAIEYLKSKYPSDFCSDPDCFEFKDLVECRNRCDSMMCSTHNKDHYVYCSGCGKDTCKGCCGARLQALRIGVVMARVDGCATIVIF